MGSFRKDSRLFKFGQTISETPADRTIRAIQIQKEQPKPKTPGKRGRKPLPEGEIRVTKWVKLSVEHLEVINWVKIRLRTKSTSKAIKYCIEEYGRSRE